MFSCFKCGGGVKKSKKSENVYILDFSHHSLEDVPPEVFNYERTLEELNLSSNRITDLPPQLFLCHELKKLHLNNNDLCAIPQAIGSLSNLIYLDLFRNNLAYNTVSENIKQCKHLKTLNLSANYLEKLPEAVTCLINLEQLFLNDTALEFLQANFGRLTNLKLLELRVNHLITLPKSMSRLQNLTHLDIGSNKFSEFPSVLCTLESLVELILDENLIEVIPDEIHNLKKLLYIDLSFNDVRHIPNEIKFLTKLQDLNLSGNQIQHVPKAIGGLISLITLKLDNNSIGKLPDVFGEMTNLEELTLNDNFLQNLPPSIGQLRKLKFLAVDNNYLQFLPKEIASCTALSILSVRGNNLLELPTDIGHLGNLRVLNIVNNSVQVLPLSILNLLKLNALWLADNQSQPMVPLQRDHDDQLNYYLTCYMLPQIKRTRDEEANYNKYSSEQQADEERYQASLKNKNKSENIDVEPKRKICFSGDPVVPAERPSRLLRSPTPYPKELRNMAKALSEQNKQRISAQSYEMATPTNQPANVAMIAATVEIKEARITNNVPLSMDSGCGDNPSAQLDEMSSLLQGVGSSENGYNGIGDMCDDSNGYNSYRHFMIPPNTDEFDSASSYCHSQLDLPNHLKAGYNHHEFDDAISFNSSVSQQPSQLTKVRYSITSQTSSMIPPSPLPRVPPPYHHAKLYSKISPQEISVYDSIRNNRTNIGNIYENVSKKSESPPPLPPPPKVSSTSAEINEELSTIVEEQSSFDGSKQLGHYTHTLNNGENIQQLSEQIDDNNSWMKSEFNENQVNERFENNLRHVVSNPTNNVDYNTNGYSDTNQNIYHNTNQPNSHDVVDSLQGHDSYHRNDVIDNSECEVINNESKTPPPLSPTPSMTSSILRSPSKPWVFGKHKNPTVIQFSIRKSSNNNSSNGFNIKEIPNMGLYVNNIESDCDAFEKLRKMDKILDIDGYDFTKPMSLIEANQILMNCGNVINIMVSRV